MPTRDEDKLLFPRSYIVKIEQLIRDVEALKSGRKLNVSSLEEITPSAGNLYGATIWVVSPTGVVRGVLTATPTAETGNYHLVFFDETGTVTVGVDANTGELLAGAGGVHLNALGIVLENEAGKITFRNAAGTANVGRILGNYLDAIVIINDQAGKAIYQWIKLSDATTPYMKWVEDGTVAGATLLEVRPGTQGGVIKCFDPAGNPDVIIWYGMGPHETVFNEQGRDIDFRVEGDTEANLFFLDAGNGRLGIRTNTPGYVADINGDLNIAAGSVFRIGGTPVLSTIARPVLTANRTYYVRTDGNDSNTGLVDSAGGAFLTIQKAVDTISDLDINGYTATIQVRDGTYTGGVTLKNVVGYNAPGDLVIQGNSGTPANVLINTTGDDCFEANAINTAWDIKDMKLQTNTTGHCLLVRYNAIVRFGNLVFGACAGYHISALYGGEVTALSNYSITGACTRHWNAQSTGVIVVQSITVTITGTPALGTFAFCNNMGVEQVNANTFSGSATGKRYDVQMNGVVVAQTTLPGDVAGTTATGGQYA